MLALICSVSVCLWGTVWNSRRSLSNVSATCEPQTEAPAQLNHIGEWRLFSSSALWEVLRPSTGASTDETNESCCAAYCSGTTWCPFLEEKPSRRRGLIRPISDSTPNVLHQILICSSRDNVALEVNTLHVSKSYAPVVFFWSQHTGGITPRHDVPKVLMRQQPTKQFNHFLSLGLHIPVIAPCLSFGTVYPACAVGITRYV